ncbi:ATP-binding protein [Streptomyces sp. NPDC007205]|uniref:ATP-binding protein n=1 Tax=Streptomyces sp. NPDC007205 TaxID=3154316 RepID=UPI0033D19893
MHCTTFPSHRRVLRSSPVCRLPFDEASASTARQMVKRFVREVDHGSLADDSQLVASELVANAVRHGVGPVWLALRHVIDTDGGQALHLLVGDHGPGCRLDPPAGGDPLSCHRTSGRGLCIVDSLATVWGSTLIRGKHVVWAALQITPAESAFVILPR